MGKRTGKIDPYLDRKGKINCNIVASNGNVLFSTNQGYERREGFKRGLLAAWKVMRQFKTEDEIKAFADGIVLEERNRKAS